MPKAKSPVSAKKTITKKVAAKSPAKKAARVKKTVEMDFRPFKTKLTRSDILGQLVADAEITPKQSRAVLHSLEQMIFASLCKGAVGQFTIPGVIDMKAIKVPAKKIAAIKKGTMVKNPFNGGAEEPHKGRPASVRPASVKPKVRPLSKLRSAVLA